MNKLISYFPKHEKKSKEFLELVDSNQTELDELNRRVDDINNQLLVDTATWGLAIYEQELNIPTNLNKPINERREVVKSKWRGTGKVDSLLIKSVVDAYTNGQVSIGFDGNIVVTFNGVAGIPANMVDVYSAIDHIKPAHLNVVYHFAYLLIKEINLIYTLNQLDSTKLNKFAGGEV